MTSPAVQRHIDEWARGYRPTIQSQRYFRSCFRMEAELAAQRLLEVIDEADELDIFGHFLAIGSQLRRLDEQLRRDLAGDRWTDTGRASDQPKTKGRAA